MTLMVRRVQILNLLNVPYETVNILEDERLRSGMKVRRCLRAQLSRVLRAMFTYHLARRSTRSGLHSPRFTLRASSLGAATS